MSSNAADRDFPSWYPAYAAEVDEIEESIREHFRLLQQVVDQHTQRLKQFDVALTLLGNQQALQGAWLANEATSRHNLAYITAYQQSHPMRTLQPQTRKQRRSQRAASTRNSSPYTASTTKRSHSAPSPLRVYRKTTAGQGAPIPGQRDHPELPVLKVGDRIPAEYYPATAAALFSMSHDQINVLSILFNDTFCIQGSEEIAIWRLQLSIFLSI